jgi:hypothetical protein
LDAKTRVTRPPDQLHPAPAQLTMRGPTHAERFAKHLQQVNISFPDFTDTSADFLNPTIFSTENRFVFIESILL